MNHSKSKSKESHRMFYVKLLLASLLSVLAFALRQNLGLIDTYVSEYFAVAISSYDVSYRWHSVGLGLLGIPLVWLCRYVQGVFWCVLASLCFFAATTLLTDVAMVSYIPFAYVAFWVLISVSIAVVLVVMPVWANSLDGPFSKAMQTAIVWSAGGAGAMLGPLLFAYWGLHATFRSMQYLALFVAVVSVSLWWWRPSGSQAAVYYDKKYDMGKPFPYRQLMTYAPYGLLCVAFFTCGSFVHLYALYFPRYIMNMGFSSAIAFSAMSLIGAANIVGTLIYGYVVRWIGASQALACIYGTRVLVSMALIALGGHASLFQLMIIVFFIGMHWLSTVAPTVELIRIFFGQASVQRGYMLAFLSHQ